MGIWGQTVANEQSLSFLDFSGGRNSNDPEFLVMQNQAIDLQNINLLDRGFEKRNGNVAWNSSEMVDSSTAIVGGDYMKFNDGTELIGAVAGTKFFTDRNLSGTMADKTGVVSITSNKNNIWTAVHFNDLQIWFGGAPNNPFKHDGSTNNASLLGGSPPAAQVAFVANNRVFAISTSANPSRVQWCVLSDPEDWTGDGSGNTDVSKNDGEPLLWAEVLGSNTAVLFKNTSTHLMILDQELSSFPVFQLQKGIGAAGRYCIVNVNGFIYFITPSKRMKATQDGITFLDFPDSVNDLWDSVDNDRLQYTRGIYYPTRDQIHWIVTFSGASSHNRCIVWDLKRKAWLYHPTGHTSNVSFLLQNRRLFTGNYDGKLYEQDKASTWIDNSEGGAAIDAYWQSKWVGSMDLSEILHPLKISVALVTQTSGSITLSYGFDFSLTKNESLDQTSIGAQWDVALWDVGLFGGQNNVIRNVFAFGRGNVFSFKLRNASENESFKIQGVTIPVRPIPARKEFLAK